MSDAGADRARPGSSRCRVAAVYALVVQANAETPATERTGRVWSRCQTVAGVIVLAVLYSRVAETSRAGTVLHAGAEAAVLTLAVTVFAVRSYHGGSRGLTRLTGFWVAAVLYLAVLYASSIWAVDGGEAIRQANTLVINLLVVYLLVEIFDSPSRQRLATWTVIVVGGGLAALAIFQKLTKTYDTSYFGLAQAAVQQIVGQSHGFRSAGPVGDPNFFGMALVVVVPLALFRVRDEPDRRLRAIAALAVVVLLGGIALTYSRGALVALVAVLIGFAVMIRITLRQAVAAAVLLVPFSVVVPHQVVQRATSILQNDHSIRGRTESDLTALDIFIRHPLTGVGANNYHLTYLRYAVDRHALDAVPYAHNLYLAIAAETGLLGLATFGGAMAVVLLRAARARAGAIREPRRSAGDLAGGYLLAVMASLVGSAFLPLAYPRYLWLLVGVTLAVTLPDATRPASQSVPSAQSVPSLAVQPSQSSPAAPVLPRQTMWGAPA
jgi:hypothetical protein